ncbi:TrkH family potassium uptake protein [Algisphaera agarilytica]|uniref:Trk system potassium uptake protein TrkH n=1 Tax=Algisphaera agarilytica TaxID=1385975 RepID=A0A7X0HAB1_9BACT|nr:TrkH family potassium uptake protein [Algisphaera agarilytica]MBB6430689.1 trk system potassium uptake protein TrkH [Algisphaera agarilytica]
MNYRNVFRQLGLLMLVLSAGMCVIVAIEWFLWSRRGMGELLGVQAMGVSALLGAVVGGGIWMTGRGVKAELMNRREALLLVATSWFIGAMVAALPFWVWATIRSNDNAADAHVFESFVACYFEAMSGLTTTGATVVSDIPGLPKSLLLWRSMTHWLGGLGIVVLFVAVLPMIGVGGKRLFNVEAPGPQQQGVRPRIKETARILWLIYMAITAAAVASYKLAGLSWFESVCHSFSVVSTGGLSTRDASMGAYNSVACDIISMVFMLLAGVNFGLMFLLVRGRWKAVYKDEELRVYLTLKMLVIVLVAANIMGTDIITTAGETVHASAMQALRFAGFQTIALHTGTGFTTADYDLWPFLSRSLLIGLMFIGGCAGSTAGGIKVIRFWIAIKVILASLERAFRPQVVRPLRVSGGIVDDEMKLGALTYCLLILLLVSVGALLIGIFETHTGGFEIDFLTAATASLSTLGNIGPGFNGIGATQNYGWFSTPSLALMSLLMMLGRLEVYAVAVLLLPRFWRGN